MMGLQFNDYDIMMTTLSITPERQETFDMTTPVVTFYEAIMVREGTSVATAEEVRNLKLGVCGTCRLFTFITDVIKPNVEPAALAEDLQKYDALAAGQIDGALGDLLVIMAKGQEANYEGLVAGCKFEPPSEAAWALPKDHDITDTVNEVIERMRSMTGRWLSSTRSSSCHWLVAGTLRPCLPARALSRRSHWRQVNEEGRDTSRRCHRPHAVIGDGSRDRGRCERHRGPPSTS